MTEITDYSDAAYAQQLADKEQQTRLQFAEFCPPALTVYASPPLHYRMRAEFKIWHSEGRCDYAMFKPGTPKQTYIIKDFPAASDTINRLMPILLDQLNSHELLRRKLFQCEFLSTTTGDCLITLIYHKDLSDEWQTLAEQLAATLNCQVMGRARKQKRILSRNWVLEELSVCDRRFKYEHIEARKWVEWVSFNGTALCGCIHKAKIEVCVVPNHNGALAIVQFDFLANG
jgi:tRNA (uracil-5-)-methyltransferase